MCIIILIKLIVSNLHHPIGNVDFSLISNELKNTTVSGPWRLLVGELEKHRVDNVQPDKLASYILLTKMRELYKSQTDWIFSEPCELVEGRGGHDDFSSSFNVTPLPSRHHGYRVAPVLGVEGAGDVREEVHPSKHGNGWALAPLWNFNSHFKQLSISIIGREKAGTV